MDSDSENFEKTSCLKYTSKSGKDSIIDNENIEKINVVPIKIKVIEYKGKEKRIPAKNEDENLCEFFIIKKMRYCRFKKVFAEDIKEKNKDKNLNGEFCVYHQPLKENPENEFILCPIDPSHSVKKSKLNKHLKKCNYITQKDKITKNIWYKKDSNICYSSLEILEKNSLTDNNLENLYSTSYWENLTEDKYSNIIDKIISTYEKLRDDYSLYIKNEAIQKKIKELNLIISAINVDLDKDLLCTAQLPKSQKMINQNEKITNILEKFGILEKQKKENNLNKSIESNRPSIFIEFGAGKAGLSHFINNFTGNTSIHYLLERGSNRYKKDRFSRKLIRFKTDIKDFDVDYLDIDIKNRNFEEEINLKNQNEDSDLEKNIEKKMEEKLKDNIFDKKVVCDYSLMGIAKHICGCALDLSLTCLLNFKDKTKIKGFCLATCCHNICRLEYLNNLNLLIEKFNFELEEVVYLFKATSWLFGSIDPEKAERLKQMHQKKLDQNDEENENSEEDFELEEEINRLNEVENTNKNLNLNSKKIFEKKNIKKEYIGLISKYIIDLIRVFFLIENGFNVFYIKYCGNEITTENNLILALKD